MNGEEDAKLVQRAAQKHAVKRKIGSAAIGDPAAQRIAQGERRHDDRYHAAPDVDRVSEEGGVEFEGHELLSHDGGAGEDRRSEPKR